MMVSDAASQPDRLIVLDTTLRDGEQSPGVALSPEAKVKIAKRLCELGVDVCEVGFPACAVDLDALHRIAREFRDSATTLAVIARCRRSDIDIAHSVTKGVRRARVHVFYPTSDLHLKHKVQRTKEEAIQAIKECVGYARTLFTDIEFSAEDATRTDKEFLAQVCATAIAAGARTINVPDTVGTLLPHQLGELYEYLRVNVEGADEAVWSTHCHNDLGLAVANTLAAVKAGARQVEVTINGIGERAGNTALEEVIMAIHLHPREFPGLKHNIRTRKLVSISREVAEATGMPVQWNKAIVGRNAFLHESGIHVDGFLKNRTTYETVNPEDVGYEGSCVVLGKHSGRAAYRSVLQAQGIAFKSEDRFSAAFAGFQALFANNHQPSLQEIVASAKQATMTPTCLPSAEAVNPKRNSVPVVVELLGDGVSVEVTTEARKVLQAAIDACGRSVEFQRFDFGGRSILSSGSPLTEEALAACKRSNAILSGAIGDSRFTASTCDFTPEQGLLRLRSELGLFQNLRPVRVSEAIESASPLKREVVHGADIVFVRELIGGIYFSGHELRADDAADHMVYDREQIARVVRAACKLARQRKKRVTSVGKQNVLACSQLWCSVADEIVRKEFPDVTIEHVLVDSAAMGIVSCPTNYDVVLTPNLFGDILTDEAAALTGSLGMLPSASIGEEGRPGFFEPVHGSAPDIAGTGRVNPMATILSVAMLFRHGLNMPDLAGAVEHAVEAALAEGVVTSDLRRFLGKTADSEKGYSTAEVGDYISRKVQEIVKETVAVPPSRRPMNLTEKTLYHQSVGVKGSSLKPGDVIVASVARTLASEMTWHSMFQTYAALGRPKLWRSDRFWLAVDHTVDPSNYDDPKRQKFINQCKDFAKEANLTDYFGPNETILHTEFYRQRAVPGTVIVGADSHSCSAGCVGAFACGLGATDVLMPAVCGQTWFRVPETILIELKGKLAFGMMGKDIMLHMLQKLRRNSVALERSVEFRGDLEQISIDSRFAISNMIAEFGGIAGIFPSDRVTQAFLTKFGRKDSAGEERGRNFRADPGAQYAQRFVLNLGEVVPTVAVYPEPDNVVSFDDEGAIDAVVPEVGRSIRELNGVFIGACTTTEEELILGALVLEQGLKQGLTPVERGTRKVTPGSLQIRAKLERTGLAQVYRKAGFTIGAPGCSYCLGVAADVAPEGEIWLSSQNRNFRNRMGKGSFGNLSSAACCAASSFAMRVTDPRPLLAGIDRERYTELLGRGPLPEAIEIHEPSPSTTASPALESGASSRGPVAGGPDANGADEVSSSQLIKGRAQVFGDHIDTDAIIPAQHMLERPIKRLAKYTFLHVRPQFAERVSRGFDIVVAGTAFGSGSSREEAVLSLVGCGVKCVIAKSFSFIFGRNLLCLNLLGICITDELFYDLATEGISITVDVPRRLVEVDGQQFSFPLSDIQAEIYRLGGIVSMYKTLGGELFSHLAAKAKASEGPAVKGSCCSSEDLGGPTKASSAIEW